MGRPAKPKTPLAERLVAVRGARGRSEFASRLSVNVNTYAAYEKSARTPDIEFFNHLSRIEEIDLHWLLTGNGPMKLDGRDGDREIASGKPTHGVFFARVLNAVQKAHKDVGIRLPITDHGEIAAAKYDEYIAMASDPDDEEERIALMNLLRTRLRKELQIQIAEPGTDKATA